MLPTKFLLIWLRRLRGRLKCEKLMYDGRLMTDDGRQVMAKAHVALSKVS
jgi:hypothetical protein